MMLEQQQPSAEAERRYSPEEAGEILRLAANLQENSFSLEQLQAIASEAGISEETLQRAVREYEQRRNDSLSRQESETLNYRRSFWLFTFGCGLFITLVMAIMLLAPRSSKTLSAHTSSATVYSSTTGGTLIASSETCEVYKERKTDERDNLYEQVQIKNQKTGQSFVVGHRFGTVVSASISPTGKHVALYDEKSGELWVVATDGSSLQCVARRNEILMGSILENGNPIAGWSTESGRDRLKVRTIGGRHTYAFVEE
ncbi:MAG: hypothetical protein NZM10_06050 [Fimbriimonadales bacterium]|nr:hypothetical protein [Fimbriimonadales bacterium]